MDDQKRGGDLGPALQGGGEQNDEAMARQSICRGIWLAAEDLSLGWSALFWLYFFFGAALLAAVSAGWRNFATEAIFGAASLPFLALMTLLNASVIAVLAAGSRLPGSDRDHEPLGLIKLSVQAGWALTLLGVLCTLAIAVQVKALWEVVLPMVALVGFPWFVTVLNLALRVVYLRALEIQSEHANQNLRFRGSWRRVVSSHAITVLFLSVIPVIGQHALSGTLASHARAMDTAKAFMSREPVRPKCGRVPAKPVEAGPKRDVHLGFTLPARPAATRFVTLGPTPSWSSA